MALFDKEIMMRNIIVEIEDGIIQAVYCPDETYVVNILDHSDRENCDILMKDYYDDLEEEIKHLKNCY